MSKGKLNLFSQAAVNILAIHFMYLTVIKVCPQRLTEIFYVEEYLVVLKLVLINHSIPSFI